MLLVHRCAIAHGGDGLSMPMLRYALLRRLAAAARSRDVTLLAFGVGEAELRVVLEGDPDVCATLVRVVKSGTCRAARSWDVFVLWGDTEVRETTHDRLAIDVAWCHRVGDGTDPLANPWTSHRDLLGYRDADFFDADVLRDRLDPAEVHARAGGDMQLDVAVAECDASLHQLLRIAAATVGVLPANRRCFRLFVHLGRAHGWTNADLARALRLTPRRVRQLLAAHEPMLAPATAAVADVRLAVVP